MISSTGDVLEEETVVDITHETLIRQWSLLKDWVKIETESAEWLSHLVRSAELHRQGKAGYWGNPAVESAWIRATEDRWNAAWASQYREGFDEAMAFLTASRELIDLESKQEEERRRKELETAQALVEAERKNVQAERRARLRLAFAAVALAIMVAGLIWVTVQLQREKTNALRLSVLSKAAEERALVAENRAKAQTAETQADQARGAERVRLRKEAEEFNVRADELARKASKPGPLPDASDAALKQIRDLQARLTRADEDNRNVRDELRRALQNLARALQANERLTAKLQTQPPNPNNRPAIPCPECIEQLRILSSEEATELFGSEIGQTCDVVRITIRNPSPGSRRIEVTRIVIGGKPQSFRVVQERTRIGSDKLWMPREQLAQNTRAQMYYFVRRDTIGNHSVTVGVTLNLDYAHDQGFGRWFRSADAGRG